jgi:hypothetical protein
MPTKETPSQTATLIECSPAKKFQEKKIAIKKEVVTTKPTTRTNIGGISQSRYTPITVSTTNKSSTKIETTYKTEKEQVCFSFEDYYPGNKYVDIFGFTFFNRGKATSDRKWLEPTQILNDPEWNTLERIKKFNKPIFIDEV